MLFIAEIVISVLLMGLILIQERSSGLSGVFGGSGDTSYQTRRGVEKIIFTATIVTAVAFVAFSLVKLIIG